MGLASPKVKSQEMHTNEEINPYATCELSNNREVDNYWKSLAIAQREMIRVQAYRSKYPGLICLILKSALKYPLF